MNAFYFLLKREFWEHRAFLYAPLAVLAIILVSMILGEVRIDDPIFDRRILSTGDLMSRLAEAPPSVREKLIGMAALGLTGVLAIPMAFVSFFYQIDSLYSDRKDRSILFWKSLPVTDTQTVLSKLVTAMFVIPAFTIAVAIAAQILLMIWATFGAWFAGQSAWDLVWGPAPFIGIWMLVTYHVFALAIWFAPLFGWLLFASAYAPRAPFLWAVFPPVIFGVLNEWLLDTSWFAHWVRDRIEGIQHAYDLRAIESLGRDADVMDAALAVMDPGSLLSHSQTYIGLLICGAFVVGAIMLRRYRDET